jgi:hypothetical protein
MLSLFSSILRSHRRKHYIFASVRMFKPLATFDMSLPSCLYTADYQQCTAHCPNVHLLRPPYRYSKEDAYDVAGTQHPDGILV